MLTLTGKPFVTSRTGEVGSGQGTSDEALIGAIAARDRRAMQALYTRHNVRIYRFVLGLTNDSSLAEDIVSEVFIDVWRGAQAFKAKSQVPTWMLAIARHKALSALRRRSDEQFDEDAATAIADPADDAEATVDQQDRSAVVRHCLSQLSTLHREVLDLVYYHEKSVDEVAEIVGAPVNTVKTRMFYARKRMQTLLEARVDSPGLEHARGPIERGPAATASLRDLIFLNAVVGENCDFSLFVGRWKMIVRLAILLLLLATSSSFAGDNSRSPLEERGRALAERMCSQCHAIRKSGQSPHVGAPAFRALDRRVDLDSFMERLREGLMVGHPDMPTFRFTREDSRAFLLYLRSIQAP